MGQYYFGVIINKETNQPMMARDGYKLAEFGWATTIQFAYELSKMGRCYMQRVTWAGDYSDRKDYDGLRLYDRWQVIRVDIVKSPYPVHRPNYAAANGCADDQAQICIEVENKNNIVRWARLMIDAGRVTDIYANCY